MPKASQYKENRRNERAKHKANDPGPRPMEFTPRLFDIDHNRYPSSQQYDRKRTSAISDKGGERTLRFVREAVAPSGRQGSRSTTCTFTCVLALPVVTLADDLNTRACWAVMVSWSSIHLRPSGGLT